MRLFILDDSELFFFCYYLCLNQNHQWLLQPCHLSRYLTKYFQELVIESLRNKPTETGWCECVCA